MNIGIIGAGHIGGNLTRRLTDLGHIVFVANSRDPETMVKLARETGANPVTAHEAARRGEIVIVTIPMKSIPALAKDLFADVADSVTVVETCNYYPQQRDGRIDDIENGMTESRWVEKKLGRPVIKAFNNMYADHLLKLGRPKGDAQRIGLPVAGDDPRAKSLVMRLVDELGFDPVDAGTLDDSWRQQPGTPVYATDLNAEELREALNEAKRERAPQWSAEGKDHQSSAA